MADADRVSGVCMQSDHSFARSLTFRMYSSLRRTVIRFIYFRGLKRNLNFIGYSGATTGGGVGMSDNKEKQLNKEASIELQDLSQEVSEEHLKEVKGGDLHTGTKPIIKKVQIRP